MPKKMPIVSPPTPETEARMLLELQQLGQPDTVAALQKKLSEPHRMTPRDIEAVLEREKAAGRVFAYPPKSAGGPARYWNKDTRALTQKALAEFLPRWEKPLAAKDVAAKLSLDFKPSESDLEQMLDGYIAEGQLFKTSPAKGKPLYATRDPKAVIAHLVSALISNGDAPQTAKDLAKTATKELGLPVSEDAVAPVIAALIEQGTAHLLPAASTTSGPRYWKHDVIAFAIPLAISALQKKGPLAAAKLRTPLKLLNDGQFHELLERLGTTNGVYLHPPTSPRGQTLFAVTPPKIDDYLRPVGIELTKVVGTLISAGIPRDELRRSLVQFLESAGIHFGGAALKAAPAAGTFVPTSLIDLMRRIEPGAENGTLVTARDLRRHAGLEKQPFDLAVLELSKSGHIALHRHDFPTSLTQVERDELVTDGYGNYYIGLMLRQTRD